MGDLPDSVVVTRQTFHASIQGVSHQDWADFLVAAGVRVPVSHLARHSRSGGSAQICALASIGVINVAIWVLLCVLVQIWLLGLALTLVYSAVLLALIRRMEADERNKQLVEFLYSGLPVLLFVIGLYFVRYLVLALDIASVRACIWLVLLFAAAPSLTLSWALLARRQSGPLVVNVMFGAWLFLVLFRFVMEAAPEDASGWPLIEQTMDRVKGHADFAANLMFGEGLIGFLVCLRLHEARKLPSGTITWLQGVSALALMIPAHYILRLPAWKSDCADAWRWLCYGALCVGLLSGGALTGRLSPGTLGSIGLFLLLLRLALGMTDLARALVGLSWETSPVALTGVFSISLACSGFAILFFAASYHPASRNRAQMG